MVEVSRGYGSKLFLDGRGLHVVSYTMGDPHVIVESERSHRMGFMVPKGVECEVGKGGKNIRLFSYSKKLVGDFKDKMLRMFPYSRYRAKGIRIEGKKVRIKGKRGK